MSSPFALRSHFSGSRLALAALPLPACTEPFVASSWLGVYNHWERGHGGVRYRVRFGGRCHATRDDQGRIRDNYRGKFERLVQVKRTYDPGNLFRRNQNIDPNAAAGVAPAAK